MGVTFRGPELATAAGASTGGMVTALGTAVLVPTVQIAPAVALALGLAVAAAITAGVLVELTRGGRGWRWHVAVALGAFGVTMAVVFPGTLASGVSLRVALQTATVYALLGGAWSFSWTLRCAMPGPRPAAVR